MARTSAQVEATESHRAPWICHTTDAPGSTTTQMHIDEQLTIGGSAYNRESPPHDGKRIVKAGFQLNGDD